MKAKRESIDRLVARYALGAVVVIAVFISAVYIYAGSVGKGTSTTTVPAGNVIDISGSVPAASASMTACPMLYYMMNGSVVDSSGFGMYTIHAGNGDFADYLLGANSTGSLGAVEMIGSVLSEPSGFPNSRQHYAVLVQAGGGFNTTAPGVSVNVTPENFTVASGNRINLTVTISANRSAQSDTYWLWVDGPCGGGVTPVLVTIGSGPYNGSTSKGAFPIA